MNRAEAALKLAAAGFEVFPITPGAKAPPLLHGWPSKATSIAGDVREMWTAFPDANIGIHCKGLLVVDVDVKKGGAQTWQDLCNVFDLPDTLASRTPTGGEHWFYRLPEGHPGVPNSVEVLGKGVDVRSTNGYVVAVGSEVPAGEYKWINALPIVDAPDFLLRTLGQPVQKTVQPTAPVEAVPESALDMARAWLTTHPGAVEGQGGDLHTFQTACRLRDFGISAAQAIELLLVWNEKCSPAWESADLETKVANAYRYATGVAGAMLATAAEFPVQETPVSTEREQAPVVNRPKRLVELARSDARGSGYAIKGVLSRRSYAEIYGEPGAGKTFVALDMAYHVAAGKEWRGRKVHQGPVLYLAYEGTGGITKRGQALIKRFGDKDVPLYIHPASYNLRDIAGRKELGALIASLEAKPVLIVIDTLAKALMGGDENSAMDVGAFNSSVQALIESTGACVMIIHHSGKDKSKGARGSSALLGAIDTEIQVDNKAIIAHKQRDVECGDPIGFKLVPVVVGIDEDGDPVTSCYVDEAEYVKEVSEKETLKDRLGKNMKWAMEALEELSPTNAPVFHDEWKAKCLQLFESRQRWHETRKNLIQKGLIVIEGDYVKRKLE